MDIGVTAPDQLNIGAQVKNSLASIGRPKIELLLSDEERSQSQPFDRSRSLPAALARSSQCT